MSDAASAAVATDGKGGKGAPRAARRRSRELALQGLYAWQLGHSDPDRIAEHLREDPAHARCDSEHLDALLRGCIADSAALDAAIAPYLDRKIQLLSPVEHAALWIGCYELQHCIDIPYRVVINEAVELAKSFGGTDGFKYVNGVLDRAAAALRPVEVAAAGPRRRRGGDAT